MARGDFTLFEEFLDDFGKKVINLDTDQIKIGIIVGAAGAGVDPTAADATPAWGVTSGVDYDGNEVGTGGNYPAGGVIPLNPSWVEAAGVGTFDTDPVTISQHASGFTNGYWGILYSETATNNEAIGFIDLGGAVSEVAGDITITPDASGWFTVTIT